MHDHKLIRRLVLAGSVSVALLGLIGLGSSTGSALQAPTALAENRMPNSMPTIVRGSQRRPERAPVVSASPATLSEVEARIQGLLACQGQESCPVAGVTAQDAVAAHDPRLVFYAVSQQIAQAVQGLLPQINSVDGNEQEALGALARQLMNYDEYGVREATLSLLQKLPPSPDDLESVLSALNESDDPALFRQAIAGFAAFPDEDARQKIVSTLVEAMIHGSPAVSEAVAESITPLLAADTLPIVTQSLATLPGDSARRVRIESALHAQGVI